MSEFEVGDRVTWRVGHETMCGTVTHTRANGPHCIVDVSLDDSIFTVGGEAHEFTRIEKPQEWQGECFECGTPLTPATACRYNGIETHTPYLCRKCWNEEIKDDLRNSARAQQSALARSNAWIRGRYPDDPRWQEVTT